MRKSALILNQMCEHTAIIATLVQSSINFLTYLRLQVLIHKFSIIIFLHIAHFQMIHIFSFISDL